MVSSRYRVLLTIIPPAPRLTGVLLFACLVGLTVVELAFPFGLFTFLVACVLRAGSSVCLDLALGAVDLALLASCILGSMTVFFVRSVFFELVAVRALDFWLSAFVLDLLTIFFVNGDALDFEAEG